MGRVKDTKFSKSVSNKKLLNAVKYQCYSFYHFWVIKGKQTGVVVVKLPPTMIRVKPSVWNSSSSIIHFTVDFSNISFNAATYRQQRQPISFFSALHWEQLH